MKSQFQKTAQQFQNQRQKLNEMGASAEFQKKQQQKSNQYRYQVQNGICLDCQGKGKGWFLTCEKCHGKGVVEYCQHCKGSGNVWLFFDCSFCKGTGKTLQALKMGKLAKKEVKINANSKTKAKHSSAIKKRGFLSSLFRMVLWLFLLMVIYGLISGA